MIGSIVPCGIVVNILGGLGHSGDLAHPRLTLPSIFKEIIKTAFPRKKELCRWV